MPTTIAGIALYVFSLFPGFAFIFAREGHQPSTKRSVLRESATIILVSTICEVLLALVVVLVSVFVPEVSRVIKETAEGDFSWARNNFQWTATGIVVFLAFSTVLGFLAGSKRVHDAGLHRLWDTALVARDSSAWGTAFNKYPRAKVLLGIELKSGGYVQGFLFEFDNSADRDPHRTLTLSGELKYRPAGAKELSEPTGFGLVVVEASEIEVLLVAYVESKK
jgi:hypothetical protein